MEAPFDPSDRSALRGSRTPQACSNCRKKKAKCDGIRPSCKRCRRTKANCTWAPGPLVPFDNSTAIYTESVVRTDAAPRLSRAAFETATNPRHEYYSPTAESHPERPSSALTNRCVELFFRHHHDLEFCSFIHKPSFCADSASPFLVSAIVTLSSLYLSDTVLQDECDFKSASRLTSRYHLLARRYSRETSDMPSIPSIQANLVLALFEALSSSESLAWMYSGLAIRMALAMRLTQEYHEAQSPQEKEVRRRSFWACFTIDRLISFSTARYGAIPLDYVGVRFPCSEQLFSFGEEEEVGLHLHDLGHPGSTSRLSVPAVFLKTLKLWSSMCELHVAGRRRFRFPPFHSDSPFRLRERALQDWVASLPSKLQWSPQNYEIYRGFGHGRMFVATHILLCHSFVVTHQEYLPQSEEALNDTGAIDEANVPLTYRDERLISVCLQKVAEMAEIIEYLVGKDSQAREDLRSPFTLLAMLSAASVLLWSRFAAEEDMTISTGAQQCNRVKLIFDLFKAWASQWRMALACSGTLEIVCVLYEVAYTGVQGTTFMQSSLSFNHYPTGSDEEEVSRQYHSHCGDGYPDVVTMNQRFYDKIRMVLLGPLNQPKLKEAIMHIFLSTMWQHSWISRNLTAIDTLFLSSPGGGEPLLNEESTTTTAGG
ncbi:hypothetical protein LTR99_009905 [Exophiala xenobiotica]|uniref:Zn(2)-C6 fungal-type domain-containing protein n=1 Tax=Vermiconidia calcicola TaxID=1690605 RepID=A0AAV9Q9F9_9PEZI|nr:hypothetical protein LTR99_009905 [Exophiala xenobiotica]KAK5533170.1 hypothetical protein LTR23_009276 [Chaetothyriales sp. CCFEE 6169]KAK5536793.1 hypothetical protein LTR25_005467 [Vermiconidia calcicola]